MHINFITESQLCSTSLTFLSHPHEAVCHLGRFYSLTFLKFVYEEHVKKRKNKENSLN